MNLSTAIMSLHSLLAYHVKSCGLYCLMNCFATIRVPPGISDPVLSLDSSCPLAFLMSLDPSPSLQGASRYSSDMAGVPEQGENTLHFPGMCVVIISSLTLGLGCFTWTGEMHTSHLVQKSTLATKASLGWPQVIEVYIEVQKCRNKIAMEMSNNTKNCKNSVSPLKYGH